MDDDPHDGLHHKPIEDMGQLKYYDRDFWSQENLRYSKPHFRLEKSARILNKLASGRHCELLDVGCGPATLAQSLSKNISYFGIDMAIRQPAPNLVESDLVRNRIQFDHKRFDLVVAQGFFEYMGGVQEQKLAEIAGLLGDNGKFLTTYVNFGHRDREVYWPYNNIQPLREFRRSLARYFAVERSFPTSHNWRHSEPSRRLMRLTQMAVMADVPVISRLLGVEYFFICSRCVR